jgi:hypothetical protein
MKIQLVALKITSWRHMEKNKNKKNTKILWYASKTNLILGKSRVAHPLPTSKSDPCVLTWEPHENWRKLHFRGYSNKNSPRAHTKSELSVFGVARKLGKNLVYGCQILFFKEFLSLEAAQIANDQNLVSRNFRG